MLMPRRAAALSAATRTEHPGHNKMRSAILALLASAVLALPAAAQDYPTRQIRAIGSQGPGGLRGVFMRALGGQSFGELAALVKSKPKTFNYMAAALSKVAFMEEFNKKNGTDVVRVPFKGGGDAVNSMLNGTAQIAIFGIGNLISFIRDGKIAGLAIDGDTRSPLAPEIPTFKEVGYTDHIAATFFGIFAPAGTPQPIVDKLNAAIVKVESNPDFQQKFLINRGLSPVLSSAQQFAKELPADRAEGLAVVKASGLYPDVK